MLGWEQTRFDEAVADVFGYHSLQLGMPLLEGLRANRMPHRWLALDEAPAPGEGPVPDLLSHAVALPFPDNSLDLVLLPHALELSHDPHAALREVARVLVPEGRVVITGLNPASLWGLRQRRSRLYRRLRGWTRSASAAGPYWAPPISWWASSGCTGCACSNPPGVPARNAPRPPCRLHGAPRKNIDRQDY